jgi:hypothetical protein
VYVLHYISVPRRASGMRLGRLLAGLKGDSRRDSVANTGPQCRGVPLITAGGAAGQDHLGRDGGQPERRCEAVRPSGSGE